VRESGIKELAQFEALAWNGLLVPSATPKELVQKMNREFDTVLKDEAVRKRITDAGLEVVGGSSESFAAMLTAESKKWKVIIDRLGIRQE
jgi:tripartite-type tricarboxylate transporter receptor subunit TctC